jgi:hypothetical protein
MHSPNGVQVSARIFDKTGTYRGSLTNNEYDFPKEDGIVVEHSGDLSTLVVHNAATDELLYVRLLNDHAIRVRGIFACEKSHLLVTIDNEMIHPGPNVHGVPILRGVCIANFGTALSLDH